MNWIPPGFVDAAVLVRDRGVDAVRGELFSGQLQACRWDGTAGQLDEIEPSYWCSHDAERWLAQGRIPHRIDGVPPCMIVVRESNSGGIDLPPFMALMAEAIRHFKIDDQHWPKKQELERFFLTKTLPNGTPVSPNHASYLATFCRPSAAMKGGNKVG